VSGLEPSEEAQMEAFRKVLMEAGYVCTLRYATPPLYSYQAFRNVLMLAVLCLMCYVSCVSLRFLMTYVFLSCTFCVLSCRGFRV
jgi:hypothetical protein